MAGFGKTTQADTAGLVSVGLKAMGGHIQLSIYTRKLQVVHISWEGSICFHGVFFKIYSLLNIELIYRTFINLAL